jgi:hypothetical protein
MTRVRAALNGSGAGVSVMVFGLGVMLAAEPLRTGARLFSAVRDFRPVTSETFAEYYTETRSPAASEHGVAIQTPRFRDRPAAAEVVFAGPSRNYDLTLQAVAEEDGESIYRLWVDDRDLGERRNPPQSGKRAAVSHRWPGVKLETGMRIRVVFAGHTNGKILEGSGTAWSRGRWRALLVEPLQP